MRGQKSAGRQGRLPRDVDGLRRFVPEMDTWAAVQREPRKQGSTSHVAAPMVGGHVTSFLPEVHVYPAIYSLWRRRELRLPPNPTSI